MFGRNSDQNTTNTLKLHRFSNDPTISDEFGIWESGFWKVTLIWFYFISLESDPCLVCNNPEVPYSSLKLSTLKVDTKYTTTTQIVKLSGSHSISKISLRYVFSPNSLLISFCRIFCVSYETGRLWIRLHYSGDLKTGHSKSAHIQNPDILKVGFRMPFENRTKKCPVFERHSETSPFHNQTALDHSKTGHTWFSDPHLFQKDCPVL